MQSITINTENEELMDKVTLLLESFKKDGLEIITKEDLGDLKSLKKTRGQESILFGNYLKNES